jgi:(p)ppGpp synthase/HD superfamily hydrolase
MFSARYEAALTMAATRHEGQRRKGGEIPYLTHLVHVGRILEPYGEDAVIAGLLHDVLEDTCDGPEEVRELARTIEASFGRAVREAVESVSEKKVDEDGTKIRWRPRKELYIAHLLEGASELALFVSAADKIHNVATLVLELDEKGPAVWERFRGSPEDSLWFFKAVHAAIASRLGDQHALVVGLATQIEQLTRRG